LSKGDLSQAADRLHEEAIRAIHSGSPASYQRVLDAYEQVLLAFPEAWTRYGLRFDSQVAGGLSPLGIGHTEKFFGNLGGELAEAATSDAPDLALQAAGVPARIARRAFELDAIELSGRAWRLGVRVYISVESTTETDLTRAVKERLWRGLYEFAQFILVPGIQDEDANISQRNRAAEFLRQVFEAYNSLLKQMLEQRDLEVLREADRSWSRVLDQWEPEHEEPFEPLVERMAEVRGEDDPQVSDARLQLETKKQKVSIKSELSDLRVVYRFGLCAWALRRLRESGSPDQWVPIFEHFASYFDSVERIVEATTLAFDAEAEDSVPWSDWILRDLPEEEVHFVGADPVILSAFSSLLLLTVDPEEGAPDLGPLQWLPARLDEAKRILGEVVEDQVLGSHLLPDRERAWRQAELLRQALDSAWDQRQELENKKIRESPLVPEKVGAFKAEVRRTWLENRLAAPLFKLVGSYEEEPEPQPRGEERVFLGGDEWLPKSLFVQEPMVYGGDSIAHQFGFRLADEEVRKLLETLSNVPSTSLSDRTLAQAIRATIDSLLEDGYQPSVIFVPLVYTFRTNTELYDAPDSSSDALVDELPSEARRRYRGTIEGVPVFDSRHVPEGRVCVLDLASFGTWRQIAVGARDNWLLLDIEDHDEESALALTRQNPRMFHAAGRESAEARAAELRSYVYFRTRERFDIRLQDRQACRWVLGE
jgi:hypothetical protein